MAESNFKSDLFTEDIITDWIEENFNNMFPSYRPDNYFSKNKIIGLQHKGVDFSIRNMEIFSDSDIHAVDCKVASKYIKPMKDKNGEKQSSLPTFAFELSYIKNNQLHEGWLYGDKYSETEYYMIAWAWADLPYIGSGFNTKVNSNDITLNNIEEIEIMIINKKDIQDYAHNLSVTKNNFMRVSERIKELNETRKVLVNSDNKASIVYSIDIPERPVNMVIKKEILLKLAIFHNVIKKKIN